MNDNLSVYTLKLLTEIIINEKRNKQNIVLLQKDVS
jgi:hypothetical protein